MLRAVMVFGAKAAGAVAGGTLDRQSTASSGFSGIGLLTRSVFDIGKRFFLFSPAGINY